MDPTAEDKAAALVRALELAAEAARAVRGEALAERLALERELRAVRAQRDDATRAERIRIAALLRQRSNEAGGRHAGAICDGDATAEACERGAAEALLTAAQELEAETLAEDARARGEAQS